MWVCSERLRRYQVITYQRVHAHPEKGPARRARDRSYYDKNAHYKRWQATRLHDRNRGRDCLSWDEARPLMEMPCHYCGVESGGLDRLDNERGHTIDNVVPCCFKCNNILGDLPSAVKEILRPGLRQSRENGLLEDWVPPPMRRKFRKDVSV